jgi:uncharacterized protein YbaP (TraB family)
MVLKQLAVIACMNLLVGCVAAKPSTPAIWRVSDADNSLYLLGSFHALKSSDYPLSKAVNDAYADAELLVFEIAPEQLLSPDLPTKIAQMATLPAGQSVQTLLPEKTWQELKAWSKRNPESNLLALQRFEPWYVALMVINAQTKSQGFEAEQGLDQHLMSQAKGSNKPSIGLESAEQQIALFDAMLMPAQIQLLEESLFDINKSKKELDNLHALWKAGEIKPFEQQTVTKMQREYPDLYQSINVARNNAWLPKLKRLLDSEHEKDALVVVGALHLLGPDGLVQKLRVLGYKVEALK